MKASHQAIRELISALTRLAEVVQEIDPGKVQTYEHVANDLAEARKNLIQAEAFERR